MATITNKLVREVTNSDYDSLTTGQKVEFFNQISSITYKTIIVDLIKEVKDLGWGEFLVEPVRFGNGYRILTNSFANTEDYSDDPRQRFPQTRNLLDDFENVISDKAKLRTRITLNEAQMSFYFKDLEGLNRYFEMSKKRISDTLKQVFQDTIMRIFGYNTWSIKTGVDVNDYLVLVDKIRDSIKCSLTLKASTLEEKVNVLLKFVEIVTTITTNSFNIGNDNQDANFKKAFNNVDNDSLILYMSSFDYIDFVTQIQAKLFNKELFEFPKFKIAKLPIPSGTFILTDKNAIQVSPNRDLFLADYYPNTLDTDLISHNWFYMGVNKNAFGVKLTFSDSSKTTIDTLMETIKTSLTPPTTTKK